MTDYPLAFLAHQLAQARSTLRLNPQDFPDFSATTLATTIPAESTTVTLLSQLVKGLVTISHKVSGLSLKLGTLSQENEAIREELHDVFSQLDNHPHTQDQSPPKRWLPFRHSFTTCHIICQPQSLLPPKRRPPPHVVHTPLVTPGPGPSRKGKERA